MPTEYKRKLSGEKRGQWTEENLREAIKRIEEGRIGINEAARYYGIPARTLRRRKASGNLNKSSLGPSSTLGLENEKRLVQHIQRLEKSGFAPDRTTVRRMAFQFADALKIQHRFNSEEGLAGYEWFNSFVRRNQQLSIRSAEGLSLARAEGMNREEVNGFFKMLKDVFDENGFYTKPGNIFNIDETGCHLNNEPGKVLASKGARDVHVLTSGEKGENVSVIACCNAEGTFLPPVLILKGKKQNPAFSVGLPPGSEVFINPKSSYITSELFFQWLKYHFTPRKPQGKVLLLVDGHSSHQSSIEMLDFADNNDIILVCLPSHTTQALQPLDRSFFKPFKTFYKKETMVWVQHNKKSIKKVHAGTLIGNAWVKSASAENAINGFRATGVFPLNPDAVPEHFFSIADSSVAPNSASSEPVVNSASNEVSVTQEATIDDQSGIPGTSKTTEVTQHSKETPSKHLHEISPVPFLEKKDKSKRKQSARVLDKEFIAEKKRKINEKSAKESKRHSNEKKKTHAKQIEIEPSDDSDEDLEVDDLDNISDSDEENKCLECFEDYSTTTSTVDWVQCIDCKKWMHETCTIYDVWCNICGRKKNKSSNKKQLPRATNF